jgi:DNA-directed RNA polymerase specialized sigma24 family protein
MDPVPLARLEQEWRSLQPRLGALYRAWRAAEPALARFETPLGLLRFLRTPGAASAKDDALAALLRHAVSEPLAGRLLLEALLPGLKALARRVLLDPSEREAVWALLLACAWERIVTYPLARRPRKIAANILLDALNATVATLAVERARAAELTEREAVTRSERPGLASGDVETLLAEAVRAGAIRRDEGSLVLASRFEGRTLKDLAAGAGTEYNTMKLRRQRAERRLLLFLGYPPVPRGAQHRPSSLADA